MVSSVSSFDPLAYLNQIKGLTPAPTPAPSPTPTTGTGDTTDTGTTTTPATPTAASLLGLSPDILSLLQGDSAGSSNGGLLSTLIGSSSIDSTDPLAGLYGALLSQNSSIAPTQVAIANTPPQTGSTNSSDDNNQVTDLINSYNSVLNAYNTTLLQNAQSVLQANSQPITA